LNNFILSDKVWFHRLFEWFQDHLTPPLPQQTQITSSLLISSFTTVTATTKQQSFLSPYWLSIFWLELLIYQSLSKSNVNNDDSNVSLISSQSLLTPFLRNQCDEFNNHNDWWLYLSLHITSQCNTLLSSIEAETTIIGTTDSNKYSSDQVILPFINQLFSQFEKLSWISSLSTMQQQALCPYVFRDITLAVAVIPVTSCMINSTISTNINEQQHHHINKVWQITTLTSQTMKVLLSYLTIITNPLIPHSMMQDIVLLVSIWKELIQVTLSTTHHSSNENYGFALLLPMEYIKDHVDKEQQEQQQQQQREKQKEKEKEQEQEKEEQARLQREQQYRQKASFIITDCSDDENEDEIETDAEEDTDMMLTQPQDRIIEIKNDITATTSFLPPLREIPIISADEILLLWRWPSHYVIRLLTQEDDATIVANNKLLLSTQEEGSSSKKQNEISSSSSFSPMALLQ